VADQLVGQTSWGWYDLHEPLPFRVIGLLGDVAEDDQSPVGFGAGAPSGHVVALDQLVAELGRHEIGGVSFHAPLAPEDLTTLARAVAALLGLAGAIFAWSRQPRLSTVAFAGLLIAAAAYLRHDQQPPVCGAAKHGCGCHPRGEPESG